MLTRSYSVLTVKSVDAQRRIITGIASTPTPDRDGDEVVPAGARFATSIPLLLHHNIAMPVGRATLRKSGGALQFEASFPDPQTLESETLRGRVQEAWDSVKAGLIRGVSIGFRAASDGVSRLKSGGLKFTDYEVLELSLVTVPANQDATIASIKGLDAVYRAASGNGAGSPHRSGGSDIRVTTVTPRVAMKKSTSEQKQALVAEKEAKVARMNELMPEDGSTLEAEAQEAFDTLDQEIKSIDAHLARLDTLERVNKATAMPAAGADASTASAARSGAAPVITVKENRPSGIGFARFAICKVRSFLDHVPAIELAKAYYPSDQELHTALTTKAAVPAGTTTETTWASPLVYATNLQSEFLEYLRPMTLIGKIPGFRRVPFNVRFNTQVSGGNGYWVGQGKGKPLTTFGFTASTLGYTKVAAIAVITEELARFSSPSAETLVRDSLAAAIIARIDTDLVDPAHAAVSNVSPASLTNGLVAMTSAGTSADNARTDVGKILKTYLDTNQNVASLVFVMPNTLAMALSLMRNSLGGREFPDLGVNGGTLEGVPVITSQYAANSSGGGNLVIAINAGDIFLADDGQVTLDASREASLEMKDVTTIDATAGTGAQLVSMFQTNSIALRAERYINWVKGRSGAVVYMDDVNWGSVGSPA